MKKLILIVLLFAAVANVFGQSAYQKRYAQITQELIDEGCRYIGADFCEIELRKIRMNPNAFVRQMSEWGLIQVVISKVPENVKIKYDKKFEEAKSLMTPAEKEAAAKAEREALAQAEAKEKADAENKELERIIGQFGEVKYSDDKKSIYGTKGNPYKEIVKNLENEFKKREFETTEEFNQRKKDSSQAVFQKVCFAMYKEKVEKNLNARLGKYDADKGELTVEIFNPYSEEKTPLLSGRCKIPRQIAQKLVKWTSEYDYFYYQDGKLFLKNWKLRIENDSQEFAVRFDGDDTPEKSAFRGKELWKDNPYAEDLVLTYKDLGTQLKEERKKREDFVNKFPENIKSLKVTGEDATITITVGDKFSWEDTQEISLSSFKFGQINKTNFALGFSVGRGRYQDIFLIKLKKVKKVLLVTEIKRVSPIEKEWYGLLEAEEMK
jgi:hypothetical protein